MAACTLRSDVVILYTWTNATIEESANRTIAGPMSAWSNGIGWSQIMGNDAPGAVQLSIAQLVASTLGGHVNQ